jgi:hypothetical protein
MCLTRVRTRFSHDGRTSLQLLCVDLRPDTTAPLSVVCSFVGHHDRALALVRLRAVMHASFANWRARADTRHIS